MLEVRIYPDVIEEGQGFTAYLNPASIVAVLPSVDKEYSLVHTTGETYTVRGNAVNIANAVSKALREQRGP